MRVADGISILDDYLVDPWTRRLDALIAPLGPVLAPGGQFPGIAPSHHGLFGGSDPGHGLGLSPISGIQEFYRLTMAHDQLPTFIHNDTAMARTTAILYLNTPETIPASHIEGGTGFWTHKRTGLKRHPTMEDAARLGIGIDPLIQELQRDGLDPDKWVLDSICPMQFNRLLVFDSALWHGPIPRPGWGNSPGNGRLIQVFFIDTMLDQFF